MKKIILSVLSFLVILSLPLSIIHAQESVDTTQASQAAVIQYKLPYPGMLPDHSLYKIKVLRDKIMLLLIQDPDKKSAHHLLLANKQLLMSKMLVDKGNISLAQETALKGENQMTLMTFVFKNAGVKPQANFFNEVKLATLKHQELLKDIITKVSTDDAELFSTVSQFSRRNAEEMELLTKATTASTP